MSTSNLFLEANGSSTVCEHGFGGGNEIMQVKQMPPEYIIDQERQKRIESAYRICLAKSDILRGMLKTMEESLDTDHKETKPEPVSNVSVDLNYRAGNRMAGFAVRDSMIGSYLQRALDELERQQEWLAEQERREKKRGEVMQEMI